MSQDPEEFTIKLASLQQVDTSEAKGVFGDLAALPVAEEEAKVAALTAENTALRERLAKAESRAAQYFDIIERVLKQRDDWRQAHETTVAERGAALMVNERSILTLRQWCAKAIVMLNALRKEHGLEPIASPDGLIPVDGPPVGGAEAYWERMINLTRELRMGIVDAIAERDAVAAGCSVGADATKAPLWPWCHALGSKELVMGREAAPTPLHAWQRDQRRLGTMRAFLVWACEEAQRAGMTQQALAAELGRAWAEAEQEER